MARLSDRIIGTALDRVQTNENLLINGGFDIAQRYTSKVAVAGEVSFGGDRWRCFSSGGAYQIDILAAGVFPKQRLRMEGGAGSTVALISQRLEAADAREAVGQQVTFTMEQSDYTGTVDIVLYAADAFDDWTTSTLVQTIPVVLNSADGVATHSVTFDALPDSVINGLELRIQFSSGLGAGEVLELITAKLEKGVVSTPFVRAGNTIAGELAMCQRYYEFGQNRFDAFATNGGNYSATVSYRTEKRVTPTLVTTNQSVAQFNPTIQVFTSNTGGFALYHQATADANANFVDNWTADAEL